MSKPCSLTATSCCTMHQYKGHCPYQTEQGCFLPHIREHFLVQTSLSRLWCPLLHATAKLSSRESCFKACKERVSIVKVLGDDSGIIDYEISTVQWWQRQWWDWEWEDKNVMFTVVMPCHHWAQGGGKNYPRALYWNNCHKHKNPQWTITIYHQEGKKAKRENCGNVDIFWWYNTHSIFVTSILVTAWSGKRKKKKSNKHITDLQINLPLTNRIIQNCPSPPSPQNQCKQSGGFLKPN